MSETPSQRPSMFPVVSRASFSFGGGFYAWPYHTGVAAFLQDHDLVHPDARLYGVSSGTVPAVLLACGIDVAQTGFEQAMRANDSHLSGRFGPYLKPSRVRASFEKFAEILPEDAHVRCTGKLFVVLTEVPSMRRRVVSEFPTRGALADALIASMAIPGHGVPMAYRAHHLDKRLFIDGGFVANTVDDDRPGYRTIRVGVLDFHSAFLPVPRGLDIRPSRELSLRARLWVDSDDARLALHRHGYEDAKSYFERGANSQRIWGNFGALGMAGKSASSSRRHS